MSKASEHTSGSNAHAESKGEGRHGESAVIDRFADFASFVVQTAAQLPGGGGGEHHARPGWYRRPGELGRSMEPYLPPDGAEPGGHPPGRDHRRRPDRALEC